MQSLEFYIGNPQVQIPEPDNWQALQIELSFENNSPESILNSTKLVWKGANADYMNSWLRGGITGSTPGIFEGIPLTIKICNSSEVVFDGIVDLTDPDTIFACDTISVTIRDKRMDMVSQLMDSVSYAYLATPTSEGGAGVINPAPQSAGGDYVVIPYQKNDIPDYIQFFALGLSIFTIVDKIEDVVTRMAGLVGGEGAAIGDTSAKVGADADGSILGIFLLIGYVVYVGFLLILMHELIKAAFNYLVSPVFTKFGMYAKDLIQKACNYFNIGFSSTIFNSAPFDRLVVMPAKSAWSSNKKFTNTLFNNGLLGPYGISTNTRMEYDDLYNWQARGTSTDLAAYGYYDGTPGDLIRALEEVFNAKAKIIFNSSGYPVLHFERWDFQYNLANYQMPNISDQTPFNSSGVLFSTGYSQSAFGTNAHELPANYQVRYQLDQSDLNTYNAYEGTMCLCTTRPVSVNNTRNVLLQNLVDRAMPFAQAYRKEEDSIIEVILGKIYTAFATLYTKITGIINIFGNLYNSVQNILSGIVSLPTYQPIQPISITASFSEKYHMLLSNHVTSVPKLFIAGPSQSYGGLIPSFSDWTNRHFTGVTVDQNNRGGTNMSLPNLSSRALMRDFHFSSLPLTRTPSTNQLSSPYPPNSTYFNQYLTYKNQQIPLCCADYELVKNNNVIKTFDGKEARVQSLGWNLFKGLGQIDYKVRYQYTNNLQASFVIDGKQVAAAL